MSRLWTPILLGGAMAILSFAPAPEVHVLILMGDTDGYLSPCGCTKPMTGGIRRRATAVRSLTAGRSATVLENGGLAHGSGRQDHLKAEALAEALRHMGVTAIHLTPAEAALGGGLIQSLQNLGGDVFIQSNLRASATNAVAPFRTSGPFVIGAAASGHRAVARALGESSDGNDEAVRRLIEEAEAAGKAAVLMLHDGRTEAERLARAFPGLAVIQYRSTGRPADVPIRIGETVLVSPGEKGKHLLRVLFEDGKFRAYAAVELGPEFGDDETVTRVYRRYLAQVESEDLLGRLPREAAPKYAGTASCTPCHAVAAKIWSDSAHAKALQTLISEGHGRDPDCVSCHVVGLDKSTGFRSVKETPQLADVGCESCHGPGAAHVESNGKTKLGKVGERSCAPCHVPEHSPGFSFAEYWNKIAH